MSQKIVVVESEKSPKVCSSNWKEDVILGKNVAILDKSKKTVLNRITVDQKILLRRFQTRLSRSKMSYARATGNVDLQQRLREKTTFVLNTNIGHNDDEDDTLHRVWTRGRRAYHRRVDADPLLNRRQIGAFTCIEDDDNNKPAEPPVTSERSGGIPDSRLSVVNLRPNTVITLAKTPLPAVTPKRRPHTTSTAQRDIDVIPTITVQTPGGTEDTVSGKGQPEKKRRPQTTEALVQDTKQTDTTCDVISNGGRKRRPSTAEGLLQTITNFLEPEPPSQSKPSPRHSVASGKSIAKKTSGGGAGIGSVFQSDEFQISLVDFQRFRVHSANYEAKVQRYGSKVESLKLDRSRDTDYYTARLSAESARVRPFRVSRDVTMAPSECDVRRATGNLQVRSLTTKSLDLDYVSKFTHKT